MVWLFRYFWFIAAAAMLRNVPIWRRQLSSLVARGVLTRAEAERFMRGAALWLVGAPLALGLIALAAGWSGPFCGGILSFEDAPSAATSVVVLASWAALLWWVWIGRGAEFLGRVGPALANRPRHDRAYSPRVVRIALTTLVLWSGLGAALAWRRLPPQSSRGCAVPAISTPTSA